MQMSILDRCSSPSRSYNLNLDSFLEASLCAVLGRGGSSYGSSPGVSPFRLSSLVLLPKWGFLQTSGLGGWSLREVYVGRLVHAHGPGLMLL